LKEVKQANDAAQFDQFAIIKVGLEFVPQLLVNIAALVVMISA